jgi:hypothetical protein
MIMAFVRKKRGRHHDYYQLVESRRVDGKVRQKVLLHLGRHPTVEDALRAWPRVIKRLRRYAERERESVPKTGDRSRIDQYRLEQAASMERQADDLEEKLGWLREYEQRGVVSR